VLGVLLFLCFFLFFFWFRFLFFVVLSLRPTQLFPPKLLPLPPSPEPFLGPLPSDNQAFFHLQQSCLVRCPLLGDGFFLLLFARRRFLGLTWKSFCVSFSPRVVPRGGLVGANFRFFLCLLLFVVVLGFLVFSFFLFFSFFVFFFC